MSDTDAILAKTVGRTVIALEMDGAQYKIPCTSAGMQADVEHGVLHLFWDSELTTANIDIYIPLDAAVLDVNMVLHVLRSHHIIE